GFQGQRPNKTKEGRPKNPIQDSLGPPIQGPAGSKRGSLRPIPLAWWCVGSPVLSRAGPGKAQRNPGGRNGSNQRRFPSVEKGRRPTKRPIEIQGFPRYR